MGGGRRDRVGRAPRVSRWLAPQDPSLRSANPNPHLDPPYARLTATPSFRSYTAREFGVADQMRVQQVVIALAARRVHVVLSNSSAPLVVDLFDRAEARAAGLRVHRVPARRAIITKADG